MKNIKNYQTTNEFLTGSETTKQYCIRIEGEYLICTETSSGYTTQLGGDIVTIPLGVGVWHPTTDFSKELVVDGQHPISIPDPESGTELYPCYPASCDALSFNGYLLIMGNTGVLPLDGDSDFGYIVTYSEGQEPSMSGFALRVSDTDIPINNLIITADTENFFMRPGYGGMALDLEDNGDGTYSYDYNTNPPRIITMSKGKKYLIESEVLDNS